MVWRKGAHLRFGEPKKMAGSIRSLFISGPIKIPGKKSMGLLILALLVMGEIQ